jgi:N6-adenosine-specific RNA methylase IME4
MDSQMSFIVDEEFKSLIPPLTEDEHSQLLANVVRDGVLDPFIVWDETGILLDGHHRYSICEENEIEFPKPNRLKFKSRDDAKAWLIKHQFGRRNLQPFQRVELALKLEPLMKDRAKHNQRLSCGRGKKGCQKSDNLNPVDTKRELATIAGVSHDTIAKGKAIAEKADEETKQRLREGKESINRAHAGIIRKEKEKERESKRAADMEAVAKAPDPAKIEGVFSTIVIDPPWQFTDEGDVDMFGRGRPDYATMTIEEIAALPVGERAANDAHIYLWITNRSLPKGFDLLDKWGFRYVTCLTWCKPSFGMGNYFRGSTEQVLFGVRGSLPLKRNDVGTWFEWPRPGKKHSAKPPEFFELIESCSHGPYLEMFSRTERAGWTHWGSNAPTAVAVSTSS